MTNLTKGNRRGMENICLQFSGPVASARNMIKLLPVVVKSFDFESDIIVRIKVAKNSFQHIVGFLCVIINTLYQLMLQS